MRREEHFDPESNPKPTEHKALRARPNVRWDRSPDKTYYDNSICDDSF